MPRTVLAGVTAVVILGLAAFTGTAIAAPPEQPVVGSDTFADESCGIPGTATIRFAQVIRETDDAFSATGMFRYQFTATETGKSITALAAGPTRGTTIVDEEAGTITFVTTYIGLPEKVSITGGPTLSRDAGTVTFTTTFALDPETGEPVGEPLSNEISFLHGPHPELESDFNLFCEEVVPYLLDP
jgi:hypothetical protein